MHLCYIYLKAEVSVDIIGSFDILWELTLLVHFELKKSSTNITLTFNGLVTLGIDDQDCSIGLDLALFFHFDLVDIIHPEPICLGRDDTLGFIENHKKHNKLVSFHF